MSAPSTGEVEAVAVAVAVALGEAMEGAGIPYFVGCSVASSVHGIPRFTRDLDVVVDLKEAQIPGLLAAAGPDFDIDEESLREEARRRGSWNIFHVPSVLKIDLFFLKGDPFSQSQLARRVALEVRMRLGKDSVHWRKGTWGSTRSTRWRAVSCALLELHEGHTPRRLHEKATSNSSPHAWQRTREKPFARTPQSR